MMSTYTWATARDTRQPVNNSETSLTFFYTAALSVRTFCRNGPRVDACRLPRQDEWREPTTANAADWLCFGFVGRIADG
jgi:hypothetical protein